MENTCDHISKVVEWGFDESFNYRVALWGCTECDATSPTIWKAKEIEEVDHTKCGGPSVCFGCKAQGLAPLMSTGDASNKVAMPKKKWEKELQAYRDARAQGIQPAGTSMKKVQEAVEISNKTGKAFGV